MKTTVNTDTDRFVEVVRVNYGDAVADSLLEVLERGHRQLSLATLEDELQRLLHANPTARVPSAEAVMRGAFRS